MNPPPAADTSFDQAEVERRQIALGQRLLVVQERIANAGGDQVALLPISKGHPVEAAVAASRLGLSSLGENYAQEMLAKAVTVAADRSGRQAAPLQWHFIGQLQTNKVRMVAEHVSVWQSVDRAKVGREIAKRAPGATVFAQVNLSSEPQKAGCAFDDLPALVDELRSMDLDVDGLMGVGSADDPSDTARGFAQLRAAVDAHGLNHCSMGMTADLELAIAEGSTMVRVGTDLFGPRL